jgi:uncharacterized repeat protein (TIGR03803 family)
VFRITAKGVFTTLAHFHGTDGYSSSAPLIQARDGVLYGTAEGGGAKYYGTVFRVTTNGDFTLLYSFTGPDGSYPVSALVESPDGYLYGTTRTGGAYNYGTVFKITTNGVLTTLLSFNNTNGAYPSGGLLPLNDDNGNFLGTTERGGTKGAGTIYKIAPNGTLISSFSFGYTNGSVPKCTLVHGDDGHFYGTTKYGGPGNGTNGYGSVFRFTLAGELTTLALFDNQNGSTPDSGLLKTKDGSLYGVALFSTYRIMSTGAIAPIALFYSVNYQYPFGLFARGNLAEGPDARLYGVTEQGGTNTSQGTIYSFELRPTFQIEHAELDWHTRTEISVAICHRSYQLGEPRRPRDRGWDSADEFRSGHVRSAALVSRRTPALTSWVQRLFHTAALAGTPGGSSVSRMAIIKTFSRAFDGSASNVRAFVNPV